MKIIKNHVPTTSKKYTKIAMKPQYITVHSTANPNSTAKNERAWLTNPSNTSTTGYHYAVDDKEVIEVAPTNMVMWHAGDGRGNGNMKSIGIEICESGNREKTLSNAIELIVHLMNTHNIAIDKVVRHYDWSKKNCPRILNTDKKWTLWKQFHNRVMKAYSSTPQIHNQNKTKFNLNGKVFTIDGFVKDGKTHVITRELLEALGFKVGWDNNKKAVTVDGKAIDFEKIVIDGKTYAVARPLLEKLGCKVGWDAPSKTVTVNK